MIESLQELGRSMMRQWAQNTQRDAIQQASGLQKHSKKLQCHTTFGVIHITQQIMRDGRRGPLRHPFRELAKVTDRCPSRTPQSRSQKMAGTVSPSGPVREM